MRRYLLLILTLLLGLYLWLTSLTPPLTIQTLKIPISARQALVGKAYLPANSASPFPVVLLCHGVNSTQNTLTPLAQELARRGIASIVFDFGGSGKSYQRPSTQAANLLDASAVLKWMRQQSTFDRQRFGILGHSMGGTTALEIAKANPDVKTTIMLSIAGEATPTTPANLLLGSGIYEQLNPVLEMQKFFTTAAGQAIAPAQTIGDFSQGNARQLVFSSTADHAIAPFDPQLHQAIIHWTEQSFGLPGSSLPLNSRRQLLGLGFMTVSAIGLGFSGYSWLLQRAGAFRPWFIGSFSIAILVALLMGGELVAGVAMVGLLVFLSGNFAQHNSKTAPAIGKQILLYSCLIFLLFLLATLMNAIFTKSLLVFPGAVFGLPMLATNLILGLGYDRFHLWRCNLTTIPGSSILTLLLILETFKPSLMLRYCGKLVTRSLAFLRQPLVWNLQAVSRRNLALVVLLLGIFMTTLFQQYQSGLLNWETGRFALRLIGIFALLPGLIGLGVVRSSFFQQLERKLGGASMN